MLRSSVFRTVDIPGYNPSDFEVKEVFYPSKDGTKVPMFLTYKKGLKLDGSNLSSGMYFLILKAQSGEAFSTKLIITK